VWPHSRALVGTLALAGVPGLVGLDLRAAVKDRLDALAWYWDGRAYASYVLPPYGGGGDRYADDNAWLGLALIQANRLGLNPTLRRAEQVFAFLQSMWDPKSGGLFWVQQGVGFGLANHDRGAGATAGAAALGFHLNEPTVAQRMLDWVHRHLDASGSGVGPFFNAMRSDGSIDANIWSYNQGVLVGAHVAQHRLVGADVAQHRLTGEAASLQLAEAIAWQTLKTFGDFSSQPPSFNAMCFQNLLMLHAATHDTELRRSITQVMHTYADWTWDRSTGARDADTNLFYFTDAGEPNAGRQPAKLQDQGAMLQLYALQAWNPEEYGRLI